MAPKQSCAKYQYVVTASGPKFLPVDEPAPKDEESPADYNAGGYLPVKVNDTFSNRRYCVVRKLGCVSCHITTLLRIPYCCQHIQMGSFLHSLACEGHLVRLCYNHILAL